MSMPLSLFDDEPAHRSAVPSSKKTARKKAAVDPCTHDQWWTTAIDHLVSHYEETHLWFLKRNLRILDDPQTGAKERADILAWVNAPTQPNGRVSAFSFQACLWLYDPRCDVSAAQTLIQARNQPVLKRQHALTP